MEIDYAFHIDASGRTATTSLDEHIRDLVEQVLFTSPGERVNRPTFGSAVMQLVFAPNSSELATATQALVQGALQEWLGELIMVEAVDVESVDASLTVRVRYVVRGSQAQRSVELRRRV